MAFWFFPYNCHASVFSFFVLEIFFIWFYFSVLPCLSPLSSLWVIVKIFTTIGDFLFGYLLCYFESHMFLALLFIYFLTSPCLFFHFEYIGPDCSFLLCESICLTSSVFLVSLTLCFTTCSWTFAIHGLWSSPKQRSAFCSLVSHASLHIIHNIWQIKQNTQY